MSAKTRREGQPVPGQRPALSQRDLEARQRKQGLFNIQVRQMQALESIAESLHVAYEPQIDAFRKRMVDDQEAKAKAQVEAQVVGTAKADSVEGPDGLHTVEVEEDVTQ